MKIIIHSQYCAQLPDALENLRDVGTDVDSWTDVDVQLAIASQVDCGEASCDCADEDQAALAADLQYLRGIKS